jgi:hypothetical protein
MVVLLAAAAHEGVALRLPATQQAAQERLQRVELLPPEYSCREG